MPLIIKGSTSGQVTIDVPAEAGTRAINLPAASGNILTDGQALPAIDGSALTGVSGGKVLQVVTNHVDTIASYLIDSETPDTTQKLAALDTSITPTASDSKILVTFSLCGEGHNQSVFRLFRDNTEIGRSTQGGTSGFPAQYGQWVGFKPMNYDANIDSTPGNHHFVFSDTTNTTSSISYNLRLSESVNSNLNFRLNRAYNGFSTGQANYEVGTSQVILMEIGA